MFRKTGYIYGKVYITGWHFMDFPMPQVGDYELMVRGRYEGGDGPVRKIRIQGKTKIMQWPNKYVFVPLIHLSHVVSVSSGKASMITPTLSLVSLVLLAVCIMGLEMWACHNLLVYIIDSAKQICGHTVIKHPVFSSKHSSHCYSLIKILHHASALLLFW